jgi:pimeloyl-ACP methyl ester carboxylesterase
VQNLCVCAAARARELTAKNGDVSLAGSIWLPPVKPVATVLMHPGSGASDRDNDVHFPPIREHLLEAGIAVCSFDKRGLGGSTGRWQDSGIIEQAGDLLACLAVLVADPAVPEPVGLFGHSQGGWVVVEAAGRRPEIAFVIANSGPGVTPAEQERYSHRTYLAAGGVTDREMLDALEPFDELVAALQRGATFEDIRMQLESEQLPAVYRRQDLMLFPDDEELWSFLLRIFAYDPRSALERIQIPVLALFGADDGLVPVEESVVVYRETVRPQLLTVTVFAGADHRLQAGDPPRLVDGYLETLSGFVLQAVG